MSTMEAKYEFAIKIVEGKSEFDDIKGWIEKKLIEWAGHTQCA